MIFFFLSHCVNKIPLENYFTQFSSILFSSSLDALTILLSIIFHLNVSIFLNYLTILSFLPPFSLDLKRYFSWYFVSTFNEESSPHESYLEGKKFYHPLSDTLLLRFPFADEGNVYALVQHLLPNLRTFFSPRWWPTKTIHVRHAFFYQRCFTLSICIYIYFLWSNENYRIIIYKSPSFLHFPTILSRFSYHTSTFSSSSCRRFFTGERDEVLFVDLMARARFGRNVFTGV